MTPATLHKFLLEEKGHCFDVDGLAFELQLLGRVNGAGTDWFELAMKRKDEAAGLIGGWLVELQAQGLAREIAGKWVGVVGAVESKETEVQKDLGF